MKNPVAIVNVDTHTMHDPRGQCGHISWLRITHLRSWASSEGRHARTVGKVCKSCQSMFNFNPPALVAEDQDLTE